MGGSAFSDLFTPRMPPHIYNLILSQTTIKLRQHFTHVSSPIEAPEKADFGDIDIVCHGPLTTSYNPLVTPRKMVTETLAEVLEAKLCVVGQPTQAMNFAIPWPLEHVSATSPLGENSTPVHGEKFIQLDIHIFLALKEFNWELFHSAHGDLWNILGSTIRRFGLTVNNLGLFLRIPEIEMLDRKKSMIFLTDEPNAILEFLGLDAETWWKPFSSRDAMFEYAAGCRMFWVREVVEDGEAERDVVGEIPVLLKEKRKGNENVIAGHEGGEAGKKKLKHNDRQRMAKRPIFLAWIEEFIPKCRQQGRFLEMKASREQIRDEAFQQFNVKEAYETRLQEWKLERHKDELWRVVIKGNVPVEDIDPVLRAASCRFLKSVLMEAELWDGRVLKEAERNAEGFWNWDAVKRFVEGNWEEAGHRGLVVQQKRTLENMNAKAAKKARLSEELEK
ncbi:uncharacterized protein RSE6_01745 [Rhynchosporium secalis]|uniref:Uncharacterized protein n=1 Tax=Rhynchosporium secalis TaxID=38038 RepID=A0A1E1LYK5_RHYSE|nr:uncharacterized protein RSE6_01745 [Rhynchosporium secalis]